LEVLPWFRVQILAATEASTRFLRPPSEPDPASFSDVPVGMTVLFTPLHSNTASVPCLDICGFGHTGGSCSSGTGDPIHKYGDAVLGTSPSDLVTFNQALVIWDGTYWQQQNPETLQGTVTYNAHSSNYIPRWTSPVVPSLGNSSIQDNATNPQLAKRAFSRLATCSSTTEGAMAPVTDSTTHTWGATIMGGGSNHVLAYCDGASWTVIAE
jgi:hypothetical protein